MITSNYPWIESPFFYKILETKNLTAEEKNLCIDYHENGFTTLSNFFPASLIDKVQQETEKKAFDANFPLKNYRDKQRVQDFWEVSEACRDLASYPPVLKLLELFYCRKPIPFQTLNFSVGTQQRAHSDTIHFSSLPAKFMCGVWVALEDITEENGPLFYYPGSHRLPEYNFSQIKASADSNNYGDYKEYEDFIEEIIEVNSFEKKVFHAKKGDVLIWSSNILHGGMPVLKADSSRWSQVTHYFFEDCYYYTPMLSNMVTDELFLRHNLTNIATGEKAEPNYNGQKLNYLKVNKTQYIFNTTENRKGLIKLLFKALFKKKR
ncbi:phytanoyl-CoA dioxygenase family protein [Mucilaginibacter sp. cycad4]|uniref:phytanoyl-CoA dioxygenase family protein n=1 Tax=Mucilaginibacter sp. cycad4 TaxID=3342096 RepID=UPI002AABC84A|nr:phytanoyl-CoA dioxygenase family protein [Mucilaginibacter gossypii]WPU98029.1 phytanoyl-CoA dioxygenase family protein [Mucilaginibacter gossypii]